MHPLLRYYILYGGKQIESKILFFSSENVKRVMAGNGREKPEVIAKNRKQADRKPDAATSKFPTLDILTDSIPSTDPTCQTTAGVRVNPIL
jgi:hypothetical protein